MTAVHAAATATTTLQARPAEVLLFLFGLGAAIAAERLSDRTLRYSSKLYAPAPRVAPAGLL